MSAITVSEPTMPSASGLSTAKEREDPFRIGWRDVFRQLPDGTTEHTQIPLTAEDCLHPREGDVIVEGTLHSLIRDYLASVFQLRLSHDPHALVLTDTGVYWDEPELRHHSPDVAAIFDVRERRKNWKSFYVAEQKTRPRIIVEVVSPNTRENDVETKLWHYHRAKVQYYVIVDRDRNDNLRLLGYQYAPPRYLEMPVDEFGRLWLEPVGVSIGLKDGKVVCYDGDTGEEIPTLIAAHAQIQEVKAIADAERARADAEAAARLAAEARIRELEDQLKLKSANPPA